MGIGRDDQKKHEVIGIDGMSMCGSRDADNKRFVHTVSAWAAQNHIVPGQVEADEKSNEKIVTISHLLDLLVLKG